jgi:hypothetical protein
LDPQRKSPGCRPGPAVLFVMLLVVLIMIQIEALAARTSHFTHLRTPRASKGTVPVRGLPLVVRVPGFKTSRVTLKLSFYVPVSVDTESSEDYFKRLFL